MSQNNSRRDFLLSGLVASGVVTGCATKSNVFEQSFDEQVKPSGKMVKLLSVDGEVIEVDEAYLKPLPEMPTITNEEERIGIPGRKFVMVIDLSRCKSLKKYI